MPRKNLTAAFVKTAKAENDDERTIFWDDDLPGFGLVVTAAGSKSFVAQYRNAAGQSRRMTISNAAILSLDDARKQARGHLGTVAKGGDPLADKRAAIVLKRDSFKVITEEFLGDRKGGAQHRTLEDCRALLERHVLPKLGRRPITQIKRGEIASLLRHVERNTGPFAANKVLGVVRRIMSWYALQSDDFVSPIVRGMSFEVHERERILTDGELVTIWKAARTYPGPWGHFIHFLLLTACRRTEAAKMIRAEVKDGIWVIPHQRYKTSAKSKRDVTLPLSKKAQQVLAAIPQVDGCAYYFSTDGRRAISGFSEGKARFDAACGVKDWRLHDLRRTARSLMSRAGVNADTAERCLGHAIPGIRGIYDRHDYLAEMRHAFEALAALIDNIVDPNPKVVRMRK